MVLSQYRALVSYKNKQALFATSAKKWFIGQKFSNTLWLIYFRSRSCICDLSRGDYNVTTAAAVGSSLLLHAIFAWDGQLGKCEICDAHSRDAENLSILKCDAALLSGARRFE